MTGNVRRNLAVTLVAGGTDPLKLRLGSTVALRKGSPVSAALRGQGGTPAYAYSLTAGALPTTATFTASISTTVMTVTAVANGTIVIGQPIFGTGVAAGQKVLSFGTGAGGTGTYNLSISNTLTSRAMTATLLLATATGLITGTPSVAGAYSFTAQVQDSTATVFTASFEMPVGHLLQPLATNPTPMEQYTLYSYTFSVSGATGTVTWALTSGTLPAGLSLSAGGVLSGLPNTVAAYSFTLTATDSGSGDAVPFSFTTTVASAIVVNTTVIEATVIAGTDYKVIFPTVSPGGPFGAHGGVPPYKYSSSDLAANLPWATLNPDTGFISGTPTNKGFHTFSYTITDSIGGVSLGNVGHVTVTAAGMAVSTVVNEGLAPTVNHGATMNAITEDVFIPANSSVVVVRKLTIAAGKTLTIGAGAILRII